MPRNQINFLELSRVANSYLNTIFLHDLEIGPLEIKKVHLTEQIESLGEGQADEALTQQKTLVEAQLENARETAMGEIEKARRMLSEQLNMCDEVDHRLRDMSQVRAAALLARYRAVNGIWKLARSVTHPDWLVDEAGRLEIRIQIGGVVGAPASTGDDGAPLAAGGDGDVAAADAATGGGGAVAGVVGVPTAAGEDGVPLAARGDGDGAAADAAPPAGEDVAAAASVGGGAPSAAGGGVDGEDDAVVDCEAAVADAVEGMLLLRGRD